MTYHLTTEDLIYTIGATVGDQKWRIEECGWIRNSVDQCPICAFISALSDGWIGYMLMAKDAWRDYFGDVNWHECSAIEDVMRSADYPSLSPNRLRLLSALGLSDDS